MIIIAFFFISQIMSTDYVTQCGFPGTGVDNVTAEWKYRERR